jgi:CubicO group peptidase (beta-lactamase class C family)
MLTGAFDPLFEFLRDNGRNGGLLVVQRGRLVYERYFGMGHREAAPNLASITKSVTSICTGMVMGGQLDERVFTPKYLPLSPEDDPRKEEIRLGQLLAMSAGIRGNSPCKVRGRAITVEPPGPDGFPACVDETALKTGLWCAPGQGWSYATASVHLASMVFRRAAGMQLEEFVRRHLAVPMQWGRWGWGYRQHNWTNTPGGGGIALRAVDLAKFGTMLLDEGKWQGRRIVPAAYVHHCSTASPYNPHSPYSLQFDVNAGGELAGVPTDAYWKSGSGGHCLCIMPSLKLVAVKLAGRDGQYSTKDTGIEAGPVTNAPTGSLRREDEAHQREETLRRIAGIGG